MSTTEECPGMNVGTGKFSDDVEMTTVTLNLTLTLTPNPTPNPNHE